MSGDESELLDSVAGDAAAEAIAPGEGAEHKSLRYSLLGPSLTKAGQDSVDQSKVSDIIYNASKGSKFFNHEESRDKLLTQKIDRILAHKKQLEKLDLALDRRRADEYIAELELSRDLSQSVVHIDCDAFYAAVEELDRPELKDVPMAVGKGVLTTCNYHARKFGCRSGMAGFVAMKLCPSLICLPLDFAKYTAKAKEVREILADYDPRFESASIDEAYLNITEYCNDHEMEPEEAVAQLRAEVAEKTKITISAGIAANAKLAKIGSNKNKPNGQFLLPRERSAIMSFMAELPIRSINGIGRVFERELKAVGVEHCGDIYTQRMYLSKLFGEKAFHFLMQCYLGLGRTKIQPAEEYERKSIGTESTFHDICDPLQLRTKLRRIAEELEKDMARTQFKGRTLVLKVKLHTYEVLTRQHAPPTAVSKADELYTHALPMLSKLEREIPGMRLRLMGLRCTHLLSTKKAGINFFGIRASASAAQSTQRKDSGDDESEWEQWPDEEFEQAARQEKQDEMNEVEQLSQEDPDPSTISLAKGGHLVEANPKRSAGERQDDLWDCPICSLPQPAEDKAFNDHIDHCLSRQTIREVVQDVSVQSGPPTATASSSAKSAKRKEGPAGRKPTTDGQADKRQRPLFFG